MVQHKCDPAKHPLGGLVTAMRGVDAVIDILAKRTPSVIAEVDDCLRCRVQLSAQLAASIAAIARDRDGADATMHFEMYRANLEAALDRGDTEVPDGGL